MRVIVVGSGSFAVAILKKVREEGHWVSGVWATEGDKLWDAGFAADLPILEDPMPEDAAALHADLLVSVNNYALLGPEMRRATVFGAIGYHPSLLPRHRGGSAVQWTIEMGDAVAGGTVFWLDDGIDTGPIARQGWCHVVPGWGASELWRERLFGMGVALIAEELRELDKGCGRKVTQDERVATSEPMWEDQDKEAA